MTDSGTGASIILGAPLTASSAGIAIQLSTIHGKLVNNAGVTALSTANGNWRIYLPQVTGNTFGGLASGNAAIWNTPAGGASSAAGDRYLFAQQPMLTVDSTNDTKVYGTDISATGTNELAGHYTITGFINASTYGNVFTQDVAADTYLGQPAVTSAGAAPRAHVQAGGYRINTAAGSLVSNDGYGFTYGSSGILTVNPLPVSVALSGNVTKTYDGTTNLTHVSSNTLALTAQGVLVGDTVGLVGAQYRYDSSAVSNAAGITASAYTLGNGDYTVAPGFASINDPSLGIIVPGAPSPDKNPIGVDFSLLNQFSAENQEEGLAAPKGVTQPLAVADTTSGTKEVPPPGAIAFGSSFTVSGKGQ